MSRTSVEVVAKTMWQVPSSVITTFLLYIPRFLLAELNTHRLLVKSAQSSRAIPVLKRIATVINDPFVPDQFSRNQKGMSAEDVLDPATRIRARTSWEDAKVAGVRAASELAAMEVHKQHANRLLEPFAYVWVVVTATEWDNFYMLRDSKYAQPEFQELAAMMRAKTSEVPPRSSRAHLPFVTKQYVGDFEEVSPLARQSAARCARASYFTHIEGEERREPTQKEDIDLANRLITDGHMSPFDHVAFADQPVAGHQSGADAKWYQWMRPEDHRQFWGWIPYRVTIERGAGMCRRNSYARFCAQ